MFWLRTASPTLGRSDYGAAPIARDVLIDVGEVEWHRSVHGSTERNVSGVKAPVEAIGGNREQGKFPALDVSESVVATLP